MANPASDIRRMAYALACKRGHRRHAEDLAQDVVEVFLRNPRRKALVDDVLTDVLRREFGDARHASFEAKRALDFPLELTPGCALVDPPTAEIGLRDILDHCTNPRAQGMLEAHALGYTNVEIAELFEVTDSRVSQLINEGLEELRAHFTGGEHGED